MLGRGDKSIDKDWHRIATTCANRHKRIRAAIESALPRLNQGLIQDPTKQRLLKVR